MQRLLAVPIALLLAAPAAAASGGATAPAGGGGATYGSPVAPSTKQAPRKRRARRHRRGAVLSGFELSRPRLFLYGRPAAVSFRIDARAREVPVRLRLSPESGGPRWTVSLGRLRTRVRHTLPLTGTENGILPQGAYRLRVSAGRGGASTRLEFFHHRFPLAGPFSYGGEDARFGARRRGHRHQGQDLSAAEGTPVVAPRGGTVKAVEYQARGAGHYVVVAGAGDDRDYVFMHLREGSIPVREGQRVRTGQRLGEVGNTGGSSGPHLHFEVWRGGWFSGGRPIDPLPLLRAWDAWS